MAQGELEEEVQNPPTEILSHPLLEELARLDQLVRYKAVNKIPLATEDFELIATKISLALTKQRNSLR
jgi:hypothetical protein